jgi:4-amino-4-deoxy-L-arabinose transferase-like glycosyltransferase
LKAKTLVLGLVVIFVLVNMGLATFGTDFSFMDEQVYETASLQILHNQSCSIVYIGFATPCNYEHTPLVKIFEATSAYAFGWAAPGYPGYLTPPVSAANDPIEFFAAFLSFRFFQLVMGALSLVLVYYIAKSISKNEKLALVASILLFLDPLYSFFSRSAYLDIPMVFFGLCAFALYFGSKEPLGLKRYLATGALLALSVLCKETGIIFIFPLVGYHFLFREDRLWTKLKEMGTVLVAEFLVFASGLQAYDTLASTPFPTFVSQISYMIRFAGSIACGSRCYVGQPQSSLYFFPIGNYVSELLSNNQVLLWLLFVWIPFGFASILAATRKVEMNRAAPAAGGRKRMIIDAEDRLFVFAALFFFSTFLENELIYLGGRIVWIWYLLPVIPSLALGGAYLLTRPSIHLLVRLGLFILIILGYYLAYVMGPNLLSYD